MFNLWLNKTDQFLCNNVRTIFEKLENDYRSQNRSIDLEHELKHFELDPLVSMKSGSSKFEHDVKIKLRIVMGIFFVLIPLIAFMALFYLLNLEYSYAFVLTFAVAVFASIRMDKIASKYSNFRLSLA